MKDSIGVRFPGPQQMKSRIIGLDLDEVLLDFNNAFCAYHNRVYGTNICRNDLTVFEYADILNCSKEEAVKRVVDFYATPEHLNAVPVLGAVEAIKKLKDNNTLIIITSKPETLRGATSEWIDKYFPNSFKNIVFTNHFSGNGIRRSKGDVCKEMGVDIFVDDNLENVENVLGVGISALLFNAPWNQCDNQYDAKHPIVRVNSWQEIIEKLS